MFSVLQRHYGKNLQKRIRQRTVPCPYYTDVVYEINDFYGELKHDGESTELRFFDINNLPENIMPTQIGYIENFVAMKNR